MEHPVYLIVAVDKNFGIGKDGKLPWHLKKEMAFFRKITRDTIDPEKRNLVIMGRTTWESIPEKYRPLLGRKNVVLTRQEDFQAEGAAVRHTLNEALALADDGIEKIFIIGGAQVFKEALKHEHLTGIFLTKIDKVYDCDTFFGDIPLNTSPEILGEDSEDGVTFQYQLYKLS